MPERQTKVTGRLCRVQNAGGGVYVELSNRMVSPIFADEGVAMAWFAWVRGGARGTFHTFCMGA